VCGLAQGLGLTVLNAAGYQPSIPFVSLQAACLVTARLIAHTMGESVTSNLIQYDALIGPHRATIDEMGRRPGCTCEMRSSVIEKVRARRRTQ
jgi:hypothetical protein